MRGVILAIVPDGTYGQLSAEDGQRYSYWTNEVRNGRVQVGQTVEFQMWEGQPIDIFVVPTPAPPRAPQRPGQPPQMADRAAAPSPYAAAPSPYAAAAPASYAGSRVFDSRHRLTGSSCSPRRPAASRAGSSGCTACWRSSSPASCSAGFRSSAKFCRWCSSGPASASPSSASTILAIPAGAACSISSRPLPRRS